MRIALLIGSLRDDSYNARVASAMTRLAPADVVFERSRLDDLPAYNQDDDAEPSAPVRRLKRKSGAPTESCSSRPNIIAPCRAF